MTAATTSYDVMWHDNDGHGRCESAKSDEWFDGPLQLGETLTDEQAGRLGVYSGVRIENELNYDAAAFLVDSADGKCVYVYVADPLV